MRRNINQPKGYWTRKKKVTMRPKMLPSTWQAEQKGKKYNSARTAKELWKWSGLKRIR